LLGPVQRGQPVPQAARDGVVDALRGQRLRRVGDVAGIVLTLPVLLPCRLGVGQQPLHLGPFGAQPRPDPLLVH
jgi:hypothetical protein